MGELIALSAHARNVNISHRSPFTDAICNDPALTPKAKALAFVLDSLFGYTPTAEELYRFCGFRTHSTLVAARRELERRGYLRIERMSGVITRYVLIAEVVQ